MGNMVTDKLVNISKKITDNEIREVENKFVKVSKLLNDIFGENAFKKFDRDREKYMGPVLQSMFEVVFNVTFKNYSYYKINKNKLEELQKNIPYEKEYKEATVRGIRSASRMKRMMDFVSKLGNEIHK